MNWEMEECDGHRSLDDFFAAFAYKGGGRAEKPTTTTTNSLLRRPLSPSGASQRHGGNRAAKKPRKRSTTLPSSPSSYLRTTVGGETRVVSRYFPLPPGASSPVPIDKKVIERAMKKKEKQFLLPRKAKGRVVKRTAPNFQPPNADQEEQPQKRKKTTKKKPSPLLSASEKMSNAYLRVSADNTWEPPPSRYKLLQERHSFDPWRVLVICLLLNNTTGKQVKKVLPGLFLLCPDAETATKVSEEEIEKVIQTLGLQKKRSKTIKQFSSEYLGEDWTHVTQLHGIGKYAADAYAIFCAGKAMEVVPQDHKLRDYWNFLVGEQSNGGK